MPSKHKGKARPRASSARRVPLTPRAARGSPAAAPAPAAPPRCGRGASGGREVEPAADRRPRRRRAARRGRRSSPPPHPSPRTAPAWPRPRVGQDDDGRPTLGRRRARDRLAQLDGAAERRDQAVLLGQGLGLVGAEGARAGDVGERDVGRALPSAAGSSVNGSTERMALSSGPWGRRRGRPPCRAVPCRVPLGSPSFGSCNVVSRSPK